MARHRKGDRVLAVMRSVPSAKVASLLARAITNIFMGALVGVVYPRRRGLMPRSREVRDKGEVDVVAVRHLMAQMGK